MTKIINYDKNNWINTFWLFVGNFFRKRIDFLSGSYVFNETGCQNYVVDKREHRDLKHCYPQKVWINVSQPTSDNKYNYATFSKIEDNAVVIYVNVEEAPCEVNWMIIV